SGTALFLLRPALMWLRSLILFLVVGDALHECGGYLVRADEGDRPTRVASVRKLHLHFFAADELLQDSLEPVISKRGRDRIAQPSAPGGASVRLVFIELEDHRHVGDL